MAILLAQHLEVADCVADNDGGGVCAELAAAAEDKRAVGLALQSKRREGQKHRNSARVRGRRRQSLSSLNLAIYLSVHSPMCTPMYVCMCVSACLSA